MNYPVESPFDIYAGTNGTGLTGGKLYIGIAGQDPETYPQTVYWDAAGTIPAVQPLDVSGGVIMRAGTPARVYIGVGYSIRLRTRFGVEVFYERTVSNFPNDLSGSGGSSLIGFLQAGAGAVARTVQSKLRDMVCVFDFMTTAEIADVQAGTTALDVTAAAQAALHYANGRTVYFPQGIYRISATLNNNQAPTSWLPTFSPGIRVQGDGIYTIFDHRAANLPLFDIDSGNHGGAYEAAMGAVISGITIRNTTGTAGTVGIRILNGYEVTLDHLYIKNMTSHGIEMLCGLYADDGWNMVTVSNSWIDSCKGWGIKADCGFSRNEGSYTKLDHVFFQTNGTDATVESVTKANPAVVTTTSAHGFANGALITCVGAQGMTQLNGNTYTVANATATTFELLGIDSTAYGTYTTSPIKAHIADKIPKSGGMIWKGQVLRTEQSAFANGNANCSLYIKGEVGAGQIVDLRQMTFESCYGRAMLCTGISQFYATGCQIYNSNAFPAFTGWEFEGSTYAIRQVMVDGILVRATVGVTPYTAFKVSGAQAELSNMRIRNVTWDNFDWPGQKRFDGWQFDPIAINCGLRVVSGTEVYFQPLVADGAGGGYIPTGNTFPLKLSGAHGGAPSATGEWVARYLPPTGVVLNLTGIAAGTAYYVYAYDNDGTVTLEYSTTPFVTDTESGYAVKSGNATRLFVGRIIGGGSANTVAFTGTGYLNPTRLSGTQMGVPTYMWSDATGKVRISNSLPATDTSGTVIGTQV